MDFFVCIFIGFVSLFSIAVCAIGVKLVHVTYELHVLYARQRKVELDQQNVSDLEARVPQYELAHQYTTLDP